VKSGVLFIGINKVKGGLDPGEEQTRLQQDADWVTHQMQTKGSAVRAVVIFAQASASDEPLESQLRSAAVAFGKPVLYLHGDGHVWTYDHPWREPNITKVQVDRGSIEHPPVHVTVTMDVANMFVLNRDPWPTGTLPLNRPPCVQAGPDLQAVLANGAVLNGKVIDDGEPIPSNLIVNWTHVTGPGIVTFSNPSAATTTAQFSAEGVYQLRLTASDGEFLTADTVLVDAQINPPPVVTIAGPANQSIFDESQTVTFVGSASDIDEGNLTASLSWTSNRDGILGTGSQVSTSAMSLGVHTVTASVTDSGGKTGSQAIAVTIVVVPASTTVQVRVASSTDDAEESSVGVVSLDSSDLELVSDGGSQTVGMRFNGVAVPRGATILDSWIQFQADETGSTATALTIRGEAADSAATFTAATSNVSSRPRTAAGVSWSPVPWNTVDVAGPDQRTPDISSVIQEIVNRPGWSSSNSLAIVVTGNGKRTAEAYDGIPNAAPLLHIEFATVAQTPQPDIDVTPSPYSYGAVLVGATVVRTFAIRNVGSENLEVTATTVEGGSAGEFAITQGGAPFTVAPGSTRNLVVSFAPASLGLKTTTLRVTSTDPDENPTDVALSGTGVRPDIAVAPGSHNFGTHATGTSTTQAFVVSNAGTGNLVVGQSTLTGPDAASFAFVSGQAGLTIVPGGTGTIQVRFSPSTSGTKAATLTIPSNDPDENPVLVAISGVGTNIPTFRELRQGGSGNSSSAMTSVNSTGVAGHLYLAAVSTTPYVAVTTVSGLGLTWTRVRSQCGGQSQGGIDLWWAQGAAVSGRVTATLGSVASHTAIAVARYSGVAATNPVSLRVAGNTRGVNGACSGGTSSWLYSFNVTTSSSPVVVFGAVALRNRTHTPGSGYTERAEVAHGQGPNQVRIALVDRLVPTASSLPLNGTLGGAADWAVIGIELRPEASP
jgi:hypothetical protein